MARQHSLGTLFESGGNYWAFLGLLFGCSLFFFSGVQRFTLLALAPMLLLASLISWLRPRWERSLTLGVGLLLVLLFSFVLWHSGPSVFVFGFLALGIWEIVRGVFLWKNEPEDAEETNDEEESNNRRKHRKKRQRIADLLAGSDDDELFSRVFDRIVRRYGGDLDVMDLQEHERVFLLAYDAWGIIGNGGFHYLFERSIRGDPHFFETAAAFEKIGCATAAEAFRRVFRLFPDGAPPEEVDERLRIYRSGTGENRGAIDKLFWGANDEIQSRLASYLRSHGEALTELDRLPPRKRPKRKRNRREEQESGEGRSQKGSDVETLPHWARVAFAVRCGRRLLHLFTANWPNARAEHSEAIVIALDLAEKSAAAARPVDGLKDARGNALQTAGAAMLALYGITFDEEDREPLPPDGNAAILAFTVAKTAEFAAAAASGSPTESAELAMHAFGWARQATRGEPELHEALWHDLAQLQHVALRGDWTDQTPVPNGVWDLLE